MVQIFGKDTCPTRRRPRPLPEPGVPFEYFNVKKNPRSSSGCSLQPRQAEVPVIVDGDKVTIGFGGT